MREKEYDEDDGIKVEDKMMTCSEDGLVWKVETGTGDFFMFLHTFLMISAAMQVERVFYKILVDTSYFDVDLPLTKEVVDFVLQAKQPAVKDTELGELKKNNESSIQMKKE